MSPHLRASINSIVAPDSPPRYDIPVTAVYHIIDRKTSSEQLAQLAMLRANNEPIYSVAPVADDLPFELTGVIRSATVWDGGQRSGWPGDSQAGSVYHAWSPRASELCHRALMNTPDRRIVATLPTGHEGEPSLWMGHQPGPPTTLVVPTETTKQQLQDLSRMACEIVVIPPAAHAVAAGAQYAVRAERPVEFAAGRIQNNLFLYETRLQCDIEEKAASSVATPAISVPC